MSEIAEAHSNALTTNRNCTVEITNLTHYQLINPVVHMESGFPFSPPQPTIIFDKPEVCSFVKDDNTASGAAGVLMYDLHPPASPNCQKVALMFSVPFDYNIYKNWVGIGVFEESRKCDKKLFQSMYNDTEDSLFKRQKADGSCLTFCSGNVKVMACMSNEGKAIVKLELYQM